MPAGDETQDIHGRSVHAAQEPIDHRALVARLRQRIHAALHRRPGILLVRGADPAILSNAMYDPDIGSARSSILLVDGECAGVPHEGALWKDVVRHWPTSGNLPGSAAQALFSDPDDETQHMARPDALFANIREALERTQRDTAVVIVIHDVACIDAETAMLLAYLHEHLRDERIAVIAFTSADTDSDSDSDSDTDTVLHAHHQSMAQAALRVLPTVTVAPLPSEANAPRTPARHFDARAALSTGHEPARRLLALVTILGSLEQSAVPDLLAEDDEVAERAVRVLQRAGLLRTRANGSLAIATPALRRSLHAQLMETLETADDGASGIAPPSARNNDDAIPVPGAVHWLVQASVVAQHRYTWLAAAHLIDRALHHPAASLLSARQRGWLVYRKALYWRYADEEHAHRLLEQVLEVARETQDEALLMGATYHHGLIQCWLGRFSAGIREMETTIAAIEQLSDTDYAHLNLLEHMGKRQSREHRGTLVTWLTMVGRFDDALHLGDRRLDTVAPPPTDDMPSSTSGGDGYSALGELYAFLGQPDLSRAYYEAARAVYAAFGHHHQVGWTCIDQLLYMVMPFATDDIELRRSLAVLGDREWLLSKDTVGVDVPGLALVVEHYVNGDWAQARERCEAAMRHQRGETLVIPVKLDLAFHEANTDELRSLTNRVLTNGVDTVPGNSIYSLALHAQRLTALDAAARGDTRTARTWLQALDRWLRWSRGVMGDADRHIAWAVYYLHLGQLVPAREHVFLAYGRASDPRQPLSLISARRVQAQVALGQRAWSEARRCIDEALALAQTCAIVPEILACQAIEVRVLRAESKHDAAAALEAWVTEHATRLGSRRILDSMAGIAAL